MVGTILTWRTATMTWRPAQLGPLSPCVESGWTTHPRRRRRRCRRRQGVRRCRSCRPRLQRRRRRPTCDRRPPPRRHQPPRPRPRPRRRHSASASDPLRTVARNLHPPWVRRQRAGGDHQRDGLSTNEGEGNVGEAWNSFANQGNVEENHAIGCQTKEMLRKTMELVAKPRIWCNANAARGSARTHCAKVAAGSDRDCSAGSEGHPMQVQM